MKTFEDILAKVKGKPKKTIAVAMAEEEEALLAVCKAYNEGLADAVLIGDRDKILQCGEKHGLEVSKFDIIHTVGEYQSVVRAVQIVREHLADVLMKGKCSTATLLRAALDKEQGLRSGKLLSHLAAFEVPTYPKMLFMSDAAMNIAPDLQAKISITENAIQAVRGLGVEKPKVAIIAAVEKVNYAGMPVTVDAAIITKIAERGQFGDAIVDGPLAIDNAVSAKSCEIKEIDTQVGGNADILIMPDIEAANVFYKTMAYLGQAKSSGIIVGAKVPIVLPSRADSDEIKYHSIAMALSTSLRS